MFSEAGALTARRRSERSGTGPRIRRFTALARCCGATIRKKTVTAANGYRTANGCGASTVGDLRTGS